ncbi:radical SAM family RiPP maturation amino acid epimerase (plasmid) [Nostoc sp. UHCC 0926]|uniref:radical SAM family RiPP maturation amino acid epimerase n=1 Tax=Nostoc sp. UHCC 0926 TaxID=3025190 RepID=UPI00235F7BCF|nr:radical SAM family RiPP maturation amino acid epimerase [Nostoc sp. UHCC 0926]WDD36981.1 radical SAM family RiPP maturation amino acid epimerase [Nostoc sp. UHCC 0926]
MYEQNNPQEFMIRNHLKRFFEKWHADPDFREQVFTDSVQAASRHNLKVNIEEIRQLWDTEYASLQGDQAPISPTLEIYQKYFQQSDKKDFRANISTNPQYTAWRARQIARNDSLHKKAHHDAIVHASVAFELSKGCSVGCWFCGISAPRLEDLFLYTPENAKLWREVLELLKEILGPATKTGFCYWATDPLDNPDYEKFCSDFHEISGIFPQTTTALALRDPERTRSLLKLSRKKGCDLDRFSVLSLKILNQIHEEFSAEELAFVSLIHQNSESDTIKANVGRLRERNHKKAELSELSQEDDFSAQGTIACVTGFLFNMVDRTVKLISPCRASDRWPLGYIIFAQGSFSNIDDLRAILQRMIDEHMSPTVRDNDLICFRDELKYEKLPDGFQVSTKIMTRKFRHQNYLRELGEAIQKGDKPAAEIVGLFNLLGVPSDKTFQALNLLLASGCLNEEPRTKTLAYAR